MPGRCVPREPSRQRDRDAHRSLPDRNDRRATSAPLFTARARRRVVSPWFQTEGSGAPGGAPYRKRLGSSQGECEKTKTPGVLVTRRAFRRSTRAVDFAVRTARPGRPFDQSGRSPEPPATGLAKPFRRNRAGTRIAPPATGVQPGAVSPAPSPGPLRRPDASGTGVPSRAGREDGGNGIRRNYDIKPIYGNKSYDRDGLPCFRRCFRWQNGPLHPIWE